MNLPENVTKYLRKYSIPGRETEENNNKRYENIIVIPAISEFENIKKLIKSFLKNDSTTFSSTLVLFVINNTENSEQAIKEENLTTLNFLRRINNNQNNDELISQIKSKDLNIAFVDAATKGKEMPENIGGVGLARKIGMDLALKIFDYNSNNKKILICTDADCTVEENYLSEIIRSFNVKDLKAAVVNYEHDISGNSENREAIICYEIFLRYYQLGLKFACSPFAFHTIGSTMCCDYESYIKIEGMNRRKAAEDFYFLEKLAKQFEISNINTTKVYPSGRRSWRVPFGTGQRINRFLEEERNEYLLYHPEIFVVLKKWLNVLSKNSNLISDYLIPAEKIHPALYKFLVKQEFDRSFSKILNQAKDERQLRTQKKFWFDGFRTLKLVHYLRDHVYGEINSFDALDILFEKMQIHCNIKRKKGTIPEISTQIEYLEILRSLE